MAGEDRGKQRCDEGPGICSVILTMISIILVVATLPFSLLFVVKGREHYSDKQFTGRTSPLNNNFYFLFLISKQLSFKLTTFCCSKLKHVHNLTPFFPLYSIAKVNQGSIATLRPSAIVPQKQNVCQFKRHRFVENLANFLGSNGNLILKNFL